ncbi:MAG: hypothetical protein ACI85G_001248, partial [Psychroserpens sp.]
RNGSIQEFVSSYSERDFSNSSKVKYLHYDWSLNGE